MYRVLGGFRVQGCCLWGKPRYMNLMEIIELPPASFRGPSAKPPKTTGRFSKAVLPWALPQTFSSKALPRLFRKKDF